MCLQMAQSTAHDRGFACVLASLHGLAWPRACLSNDIDLELTADPMPTRHPHILRM